MQLNNSQLWLIEDTLRAEAGRLEIAIANIKRNHKGLNAVNVPAPIEAQLERLGSVYETLEIIGTARKDAENSPLISGNTFEDGVKYALEYLSDLYDGIYETDIAKQYASEENN